MLLTITHNSVDRPATDIGFLFRKHPDRVFSVDLSFGTARVFYPEATRERCSVALAVDVDPIALARGNRDRRTALPLEPYVNDRPYAASSFLSVAISRAFGSALSGRCAERPDLEGVTFPMEIGIPAVPCRGGEAVVRALFEPLGYAVDVEPIALDEAFPDWGASRYFRVTLRAEKTVSDVLTHLYVLVPVLDDSKHYWIGDDEVQKLLRHGEGWLAAHPAKEMITARYLERRRDLVDEALSRLTVQDGEIADGDEDQAAPEIEVEKKISLAEQRVGAVLGALRAIDAKRVVDLGCGEGRLLRALLEDSRFEKVTGVEVSHHVLEKARDRLRIDRMPAVRRARLELLLGSLLYRDARLAGFDAATLVEVIEHLDPPRLAPLERVVFEFARPGAVIVTTPNSEYNVRFPGLAPGAMRHRDHRFEWTRPEFRQWAERVAQRFGYAVRFVAVGDVDAEVGAPTQMALFATVK